MHVLPHSLPPNPAAGHHWTMPLMETSGHSQTSLYQSLVGSLLLFPGSWFTQGSVCVLQASISQSCVSSGSSIVGLMMTSSKKAYGLCHSQLHPEPLSLWQSTNRFKGLPPQERLKHSSVSVSVESLGLRAYMVCLSPLSISGGNGVWF